LLRSSWIAPIDASRKQKVPQLLHFKLAAN
jgi:hypothetical protein